MSRLLNVHVDNHGEKRSHASHYRRIVSLQNNSGQSTLFSHIAANKKYIRSCTYVILIPLLFFSLVYVPLYHGLLRPKYVILERTVKTSCVILGTDMTQVTFIAMSEPDVIPRIMVRMETSSGPIQAIARSNMFDEDSRMKLATAKAYIDIYRIHDETDCYYDPLNPHELVSMHKGSPTLDSWHIGLSTVSTWWRLLHLLHLQCFCVTENPICLTNRIKKRMYFLFLQQLV